MKEKIIEELYKKNIIRKRNLLTPEIGWSKKNLSSNKIMVGPPGLEPGTNTL